MYFVVITKSGKWKPLHPIILVVVDEDSEVLFQFLIKAFRLTICLGMVGR